MSIMNIYYNESCDEALRQDSGRIQAYRQFAEHRASITIYVALGNF